MRDVICELFVVVFGFLFVCDGRFVVEGYCCVRFLWLLFV